MARVPQRSQWPSHRIRCETPWCVRLKTWSRAHSKPDWFKEFTRKQYLSTSVITVYYLFIRNNRINVLVKIPDGNHERFTSSQKQLFKDFAYLFWHNNLRVSMILWPGTQWIIHIGRFAFIFSLIIYNLIHNSLCSMYLLIIPIWSQFLFVKRIRKSLK